MPALAIACTRLQPSTGCHPCYAFTAAVPYFCICLPTCYRLSCSVSWHSQHSILRSARLRNVPCLSCRLCLEGLHQPQQLAALHTAFVRRFCFRIITAISALFAASRSRQQVTLAFHAQRRDQSPSAPASSVICPTVQAAGELRRSDKNHKTAGLHRLL